MHLQVLRPVLPIVHKGLLLKTITQLPSVCWQLPLTLSRDVFPVIKEHRNKWDIRFLSLVVKDRLGIRAISHYFKMLLKIREIKRVFTHQEI